MHIVYTDIAHVCSFTFWILMNLTSIVTVVRLSWMSIYPLTSNQSIVVLGEHLGKPPNNTVSSLKVLNLLGIICNLARVLCAYAKYPYLCLYFRSFFLLQNWEFWAGAWILITMKMMKTSKRFGKPGVILTWFGLLSFLIILKEMAFLKLKDLYCWSCHDYY